MLMKYIKSGSISLIVENYTLALYLQIFFQLDIKKIVHISYFVTLINNKVSSFYKKQIDND